MAKTYLHLVRHAQGYHNLTTANHTLPDPSLTPLGESQCATLAQTFPHHALITHLVASPLRRTIYTCLLSFPHEVASGKKVLALPELQETSDLPCDTGSDPKKLLEEFGRDGKVDLSLVHEGWNSKKGKWSPSASAIESRAREARLYLRTLGTEAVAKTNEDQHIVVVTHGGYLHYFTEDWDGHEKFTGTGWANTEYRDYEFVDGEETNAGLVETQESRERRMGDEIPLTKDEQRELRASAEREWSENGFQVPKL
ncbi:putative phosphatase SPAC5H10.03 [Lachnellula cervina]|uniref:Putative phosphatase SPAC5H10.03 n=1 Tax=Lachnellula cervina TaxID=1316786 RepID=A0A7D8YUR8_9HELO|nr:putative phosphatase SPAC5H10.03 [Lachnellula cervina]